MEKTKLKTKLKTDLNTSIGVVIERRGLKLPISLWKAVHFPENLSVNLTGFYHYCQVCEGRKAEHFCETEDAYVCAVCNGFCFNVSHRWVDLWETIGGN